MGRVCRKHILRLLWKMVENMFFLDSEQIRMERMIPPKFAIPIEWEETSLNGGISPQSPQIISLQYQMI